MNYRSAFSFAFQDPHWFRKTALTGLIGVIPVIGAIAMAGWSVEITRRVIHQELPGLPEVQLPKFLAEGLRTLLIAAVYHLPLAVFLALTAAGIFLPPALDLEENTAATLAAVLGGSLGCLSMAVAIFTLLIFSAAVGRYAATGRLGEAFRLRRILALLRAAPSSYLLLTVGEVLQMLVGSLGLLICCVGALVTLPFALAAGAHLTAQAYRAGDSGADAPNPA